MKIQRYVLPLLTGLLVVIGGCGDGFTAPEAASVAENPPHAALPVPIEAARFPAADVEALELSAGLRTAMTNTVTAALAEIDLEPDGSLSMLQDFLQQVEAQHAEGANRGPTFFALSSHRRRP